MKEIGQSRLRRNNRIFTLLLFLYPINPIGFFDKLALWRVQYPFREKQGSKEQKLVL